MNRIYSNILFTLLLVIICSISIIAQELSYKQFTEEDGLPSLTTYEIVQDSSGILWIGTENGLVSYDGEKFEKYQFPEFQDNDILQTFIHETGDVGFVNLANEFGLINGNEIKMYNFTKGNLVDLSEINGRNYIFNCILLQDYKKCSYGYNILRNSKVELELINTQTYKLDAKVIDYLYISNKEKGDPNFLSIVKVDDFSFSKFFQKYYTEENSFLLKNNKLAFKVEFEFLESNKLADLTQFVYINDHYLYIDNNKIYLYNTTNDKGSLISDKFIYQYCFIDKEGVLFASTQNNGLIKFDNFESNFEIIDTYEKEIISITTNDIAILVSTFNKGKLYDKDFNLKDEILFRNPTKSIVQSNDSNFIIINKEDLIQATKNYFSRPKDVIKINVKDFLLYKNKLLLGTSRGLIFSDENTETLINGKRNEVFEFFGERINKLLKSKYNDNIIISADGLYIKRGIDHKPERICPELKNKIITDLHEPNKDTLLISTKNNGVFQIVDEKIIDSINMQNGLLSNTINDIAVKDNFIVLATNRGVSLFDSQNRIIKNLTTFHGLTSDNVSSVVFQEDYILAGVGKNLVKLYVEDFNREKTLSTLTINYILVNNEKIDWTNDNVFSYDRNKIEILFNHVSMRSTESEKRLKYRIKSIDDKWEIVKEPLIRLPALAPGDYVVEAKGINEIGEESELLELSFIIKPPWWQTTLARLLGTMSIFMLFYLFYRNRMNQLKKEEEVKRGYLTQINQIKDQALQLQMNPHFIFNSLNAIQNFIGNNEERNAINYLARFARLIRLIFEFSKSNTITLEEEIEFVELYINLEKLRFKDKVNVEFFVSEDVRDNQDVLTIPPLLIQPIIENSFKHGLFHKIGVGNLLIKYEMDTNVLTITVEDDGIGRKASQERKGNQEHNSSGIKTTTERIEILSFGKDEDQNSFIIEDLVDDNNNALGTKTVIKLTIQ